MCSMFYELNVSARYLQNCLIKIAPAALDGKVYQSEYTEQNEVFKCQIRCLEDRTLVNCQHIALNFVVSQK